MLSAAFDIIHALEVDGGEATPSGGNETDPYNNSCTLIFNETTNTSSYKPRDLCQRQGTSVSVMSAL